MNNLFYAFSIKVPGQLLDNKKFFEYSDYDVTSITVPTDAQTVAKAKAFVRMKHIQRKLSELSVPIYFEVYFGTEGTTSTIPTDAELVVSYISVQPFLSTQVPIDPDESQAFVNAAAVIKDIITKAFADEITEFFEVQHSVVRPQFPGATGDETFHELVTEYVTAPAATPVVTVEHIPLKA